MALNELTMTEQEELELKSLVESGIIVMWNPDKDTCRTVVSVGPKVFADPDNEDEPSLCASFEGGDYVALYNVEMHEFIKAERL